MAIRKKLTNKYLDSLEATGTEYFVKDSSLQGFGIRVSKKAKVSFIAEGKVKGTNRMRRITIGPYPTFKIDSAKEIANDHLRFMARGIDPVEKHREKVKNEKKQKTLEKQLSVTFGQIARQFFERRRLKDKTKYDYTKTIERHFSDWEDTPIREITRQLAEEKFFQIKSSAGRSGTEQGKATATKAMRILSSIMNYAKAEEVNGIRVITDNPCDVLKEKRIDRAIPRKTNYLVPQEVHKLFSEFAKPDFDAIEATDEDAYYDAPPQYHKPIYGALALILLTGLRREEAFSLRWADVHLDSEVPYFMVRETKNSIPHYVPMTDTTTNIFKQMPHDTEWVFPSSKNPAIHIKEPRKTLLQLCEKVGKPFTVHDLRRTFTTIAADIGLDYLAIKRLLNHSNQDITERYVINEGKEKLIRVKGFLEQIEQEIFSYGWEYTPELFPS